MTTEKEKMLTGELYDAADSALTTERKNARALLKKFNDSNADETELRRQVLQELLGAIGKKSWIEPPFYCDYGYNIKAGNNVYFNFNCVVLDVAPVTISDYVLIGPNVQIYTATHPLDWQTRATLLESAKPISIGSHVWIGGGAILCPGVTVGEKSVIGAGSVVTKSIPAKVLAAGNPCKVIRELDNYKIHKTRKEST